MNEEAVIAITTDDAPSAGKKIRYASYSLLLIFGLIYGYVVLVMLIQAQKYVETSDLKAKTANVVLFEKIMTTYSQGEIQNYKQK